MRKTTIVVLVAVLTSLTVCFDGVFVLLVTSHRDIGFPDHGRSLNLQPRVQLKATNRRQTCRDLHR